MSTARTRTPSADVTGLLLDAAESILESEGADALSVRRIAAEAGVAPMGVYNHFDSKAGIIDALFARSFERLALSMASLSEIPDPIDALLEGGERYRALALEHPAAYGLMFQRSVKGFEPSPEAKEVALHSLAQLVAAVERAISSGAITGYDPMVVTQMIWAACHGWVTLELNGMADFAGSEDGARQFRGVLLAGLMAGHSRSPA